MHLVSSAPLVCFLKTDQIIAFKINEKVKIDHLLLKGQIKKLVEY